MPSRAGREVRVSRADRRSVDGFLLDVNVVIALLDPSHVHHDRAHEWFAGEGMRRWFSCPTV